MSDTVLTWQARTIMAGYTLEASRPPTIHPQRDAIKAAFIAVQSFNQWHAVLDQFYDADAPGVSIDEALPEEASTAGAAGAGEDTDCGIGSAA